jgi:ligand-binding SRPBCC domain-containing protein
MGHINRSTLVGCPPNKVFDVLTNVERLQEFSDMTIEVKGPGRAVQSGDTFQQRVKVLGKELESEWTAEEVTEPSLLRFHGTAPGGAEATLVEHLTPEGDGTRVEIDVEYDMPLGLLGDAIDAIYLHTKHEEHAEDILRKLKALCEAS